MTALRASVTSLYEVSEIVRGESFLARDLLRGGEPIQVSEKRATRRKRPWDLLATRIVKVGSRNEVTGGTLPLARKAGATLEEGSGALREKIRAKIQGARKPGSAELRRLDSSPPALVNSDGEALEATTVTYPRKRIFIEPSTGIIAGCSTGLCRPWGI